MSMSYQDLKELFLKDENAFKKKARDNGITETISALAHAEYDNGWPLGMLKTIQPQLAAGLKAWTAGESEAIRRDQELNKIKARTASFYLEKTFELLPIWHQTVTHASKKSDWLTRLPVGSTFELKSFMGCCTEGYSYAYASPPNATLSFSHLTTARLIGALSSENMEREAILPKGARFLVKSVNQSSKIIHLVQIDAA